MGDPTGVYLRISDDPEGHELGVKRQEVDLLAEAAKDGDEVVDVYADNDISASTRSRKVRPDFQRLLRDARSGRIKKIRAYTSSRLTRRPRESDELIELAETMGVRILYLRSPSFDLNTAHGRQVARIMAANDAAESEVISERVRRKHLEIVQSGRNLGGDRSFGWEKGGMEPIPEEFKAIKWMYEQLFVGRTLLGVANELNSIGVRTARGNQWDHSNVRKLLLRPRNAGFVVYQGKVMGKGNWPAPVTEAEWRAACAILSDPKRMVTTGNTKLYLGAGLFLCGVCADGTTVGTNKVNGGGLRNRSHVRGYRCRKFHHLARAAERIDDMVERYAVELLRRPEAVALLLPTEKRETDAVGLHTEANALRARIDDLDDELDDGVIDKERWVRRNRRMTDRLNEIQKALAETYSDSALKGLAGNPDVAAVWYGLKDDRSDGLPVDRRAAVVDLLMTVTLMPAKPGRQRGGGYFDASSVHIEQRVQA